MSPTQDDRAILVAEDRPWDDAAKALAASRRLAVDTESDGFHRYPERTALIQLKPETGPIYLLDPLAVRDLSRLGKMLASPTVQKVFHSADYDLRSLDRDFGFRVRGLYDTAIAAQFCGAERTGLANVAQQYLGLKLDKPKRLQRFDWSSRPLPESALRYAATDVAHLHALADELGRHLLRLGRLPWVAEEAQRLEEVRYVSPDPPEESFVTVPGARRLSGRALAILKELCVFREREARKIGRPPYRVLSNAALLAIARRPRQDLSRVPGVARRTSREAGQELRAAVERGLHAPPVELPQHPTRSPWSREARMRLSALKQWRGAEANRLGLDRGLVWPARHLSQVALYPGRPSRDVDLGSPPWVREWQWSELGSSLDQFRAEVLRDPIR